MAGRTPWWSAPVRWVKYMRKRNPFSKNAPKYFEKPENDSDYQLMLHYDGFIAPEYWEDDNLSDYPAIVQDLRDLEQYLLPTFWEYNQKSRYYQVRYHTYQWIFIVGAFVTTIFGTLSTFYSANSGTIFVFDFTNLSIPILNTLSFDGMSRETFFSICTTIVSGVTGYFTLLSNQGEPRKRWASYRRLAEELRMLYFKFISRLEPYDQTNRVESMRRRVIEVREQELNSAA